MHKEKNTYSLLDMVGILYRWRKPLLSLILATAVGSVILTLFLDDYYTATATFVPTNEEQKLFDLTGNLTLYGGDDAVDRVLIFAQSTTFISHMIKEFDLAKRYNIDDSTPKGLNLVEQQFKKLYDIRRNKHSGLEISIQDTDPEMAYKLVLEALNKIENLYRSTTSGNKDLIKETYENAIAKKEKEIIDVADTVTTLRKRFNIFDVKQQSIMLASTLTTLEGRLEYDRAKLEVFKDLGAPKDSIVNVSARIAGAMHQRRIMRGGTNPDAEDQMVTSSDIYAFNEGRSSIIYWETKIDNLNKELSLILTQFAKFKTQTYSNIAGIIILEPAQIPKLKSYPIRSLMVIGAILAAIILGIIGVLILDAYKRVDWKEVLYEKPVNHS